MLPRKIPKAPKRASRWRSQAHLKHVRSYACFACGTTAAIEAAHIRMGSGAGMGQKPDDFRAVSLCRDCHAKQHREGEETFWLGVDVEALLKLYNMASPRRWEIETEMSNRSSSPREPGLPNKRPGSF